VFLPRSGILLSQFRPRPPRKRERCGQAETEKKKRKSFRSSKSCQIRKCPLISEFLRRNNAADYPVIMITIREKKRRGILIIRPSALGDTLQLAPALYQLAHETELTLVGRRPGIDFLEHLTARCLDYEKGGWHTLFSPKPQCSDLPGFNIERVICFLTDPDGRASKGLRACFQDIPIHCFQPFPSRQETMHVAFYLAHCLNASGLPVNPEQAIEEAKRTPLLDGNNQGRSAPMVVFHPGSGSERKNYPLQFWFDLVRDLSFGIVHKKIVLLGPAEQGLSEQCEKEQWDSNTEIICCPRNEELRSLLKGASLYIGHDSGITHLAALLGTPTIALFRNSHWEQWAPLGPDVTVIASGRDYHAILERIREKIQGSIPHL
jgi:heptosyltransferase-3